MDNLLDQLVDLQRKGLVETAVANIKKWLGSEEYKDFWEEMGVLIAQKNVAELNDAFYKVIPFGTGGRRGKMGVGTNRINARTIAESAQGVADYLKDFFGEEEIKSRGAVVTYDVRHNSRFFAEVAAGVFAANGLKVYFYDGVRSTPQISFSIRFKNAIAGAMISASHNPPSDNGVKIYWDNGGQILPPHDARVIDKVSGVDKIHILDFQEAVETGKIIMLGEEVDNLYQEAVAQLSLGNFREAKIIFTPLNGCAVTSFLP
ncbi:MAG: phospho-sugar mutase, partial [Candidatus Magasanikbacteria bacterium]|nr:phospho-sugar mutase [Candidatus Magasanikbacteria bacterium]